MLRFTPRMRARSASAAVGRRNVALNQILRGVEQHAVWFTALFVFRNFTTERAGRVLVDARES